MDGWVQISGLEGTAPVRSCRASKGPIMDLIFQRSNFTALLIAHQVQWTHLVAEDADGAGGGHFFRAEPHGGDVRRHAEDEHLRDGAHDLPEHTHPEQVRLDAHDFNPCARAVHSGGYERNDSQPFPVQKPRYWEDQWYVSEHVNHGHPVYSERAHAVKIHEDVADDSILDPLIRIAQRI